MIQVGTLLSLFAIIKMDETSLIKLGVILALVLPKTSLVINIMRTSNGGMDNGQVSEKGMMIKV